MSWSFFNETKAPSLEDSIKSREMCDICGYNYYYQNIKRIRYLSSSGIVYTIRCCPNCSINTLVKNL